MNKDLNTQRPISPHITIHKWILSQIMSILHRASGIGFSIGLIFISLWLFCLSSGPEYYFWFQTIFFNFFGKTIIMIIVICFIFYFIDEFRKFFWAFGYGLDLKTLKVTNYIVIFSSLFSLILITLFLL